MFKLIDPQTYPRRGDIPVLVVDTDEVQTRVYGDTGEVYQYLEVGETAKTEQTTLKDGRIVNVEGVSLRHCWSVIMVDIEPYIRVEVHNRADLLLAANYFGKGRAAAFWSQYGKYLEEVI